MRKRLKNPGALSKQPVLSLSPVIKQGSTNTAEQGAAAICAASLCDIVYA